MQLVPQFLAVLQFLQFLQPVFLRPGHLYLPIRLYLQQCLLRRRYLADHLYLAHLADHLYLLLRQYHLLLMSLHYQADLLKFLVVLLSRLLHRCQLDPLCQQLRQYFLLSRLIHQEMWLTFQMLLKLLQFQLFLEYKYLLVLRYLHFLVIHLKLLEQHHLLVLREHLYLVVLLYLTNLIRLLDLFLRPNLPDLLLVDQLCLDRQVCLHFLLVLIHLEH